MAMMRSTDGQEADFQQIFAACDVWFANEMAWLYGQVPDQRPGIVLGTAVWGASYVDTLERYTLASVLAPRNWEALKGGATLLLYTSGADHPGLISRTKRLKARGIEPVIRLLSDDMIRLSKDHEISPLWVLGTAHNACIQFAGRHGKAFHMLQPDHLYDGVYFASMLRLREGYDGLLHNAISTDIQAAELEINEHRQNGLLSIAPDVLAGIGVRHMHARHRAQLMNDRNTTDRLPSTSWLGYRARDRFIIASPHVNPTYMSPKACLQAPTRIPATLDAEVPALVPSNWRSITAEDGMAMIELSAPEKRVLRDYRPWDRFAAKVWAILRFKDAYLPYYAAPTEMPLPWDEDARPAAEVYAELTSIMNRLEADKGAAAISFAQSLDQTQEAA